MRRSIAIRPLCVAAGILAVLSCSPAQGIQKNDNRNEILGKARDRYYNLRQAGLIEFRSTIRPNWKVVLGDFQTDSAIKLLNAIHFSMSVDAESKFRLEHHTDLVPKDRKSAEALDQIFRNMDEAVSRFFVTWSLFMITSPFPDIDRDYQVEQKANQFSFSHKEPIGRVVTTTDRDFLIIETTVFGENFTASLKPVLENSAKGYILKGYTGDYQSVSDARTTLVKVSLEYQDVKGLRFPRKVNVDTVYEGKPAQLEWLFTNYQVKVR